MSATKVIHQTCSVYRCSNFAHNNSEEEDEKPICEDCQVRCQRILQTNPEWIRCDNPAVSGGKCESCSKVKCAYVMTRGVNRGKNCPNSADKLDYCRNCSGRANCWSENPDLAIQEPEQD